jgi:Domain of unknown function (DUF4262)
MCWLCDHPGRTPDDYLGHVRGLVDRHGWAVQGVPRDRARPPWAYTTGLTTRGRPELVITGMPLPRAASVLNDVACHLMRAAAPEPGGRLLLGSGLLTEIVEVAEPAAHLVTAVSLYGPRLRAIQLVHADRRGHWPWDGGYRGVRGGQPVLGVRAAPAASRDPAG